MLRDKNGILLSDNNIIDIKQTVNGCSEFLVKVFKDKITKAYYYRDGKILRDYEYDLDELVAPCEYTGGSDWEIVGYITDKEFIKSITSLNEELKAEVLEQSNRIKLLEGQVEYLTKDLERVSKVVSEYRGEGK